MIPMTTRKLTQISAIAILVAGLGACSQAGHGKHNARYGGGQHIAGSGHFGGASHHDASWQSHGGWETQSGWETQGGWEAGSSWQTAGGDGYTGGAVVIPPSDATYHGGRYGGFAMPSPAPVPSTPHLRSRYGTVTGPNGGTCCIVPQIVYVDRVQTVEVEKIVEKPVEKFVEVEKIVEKIVEVEKPVYIEVPGYQPPPVKPRPPSRK